MDAFQWINNLEQRRSFFVLFQYQLCDDYSVLFTALIFSVGTPYPDEGNSTKVYCITIIINLMIIIRWNAMPSTTCWNALLSVLFKDDRKQYKNGHSCFLQCSVLARIFIFHISYSLLNKQWIYKHDVSSKLSLLDCLNNVVCRLCVNIMWFHGN